MPDEIKQVSFWIGTMPHKIGEGAALLNAVKDAGVNLVGFLGYPKSARIAEIVLVVDGKSPALGAAAKKAGFKLGKAQKGFLVCGEDRLGAVAEKAAALAAAGINIVSIHALAATGCCFTALIVVASADFRKAAKALAK